MTETTSIPIPRWRLNYERVRAKMAALREKEEAKRAEQDAMRDMVNLFTEEQVEHDEPEMPVVAAKEPEKKPLKIRKREKRARKIAKLKARREEQQRPPKLNVLPAEQAALLRGGDDGLWVSYQCAAETLVTKHPKKRKYHLEKRSIDGDVEFTRKSLNQAVATLVDNALLHRSTAWRAQFLQAPIIEEAPQGLVELNEAARRAGVTLKTLKKRRDKNKWHTRYFRMRQEDGTVRIALFIPEFCLTRYIDARNKQVYGKSDWEYSLSRRAQARNNRRRR